MKLRSSSSSFPKSLECIFIILVLKKINRGKLWEVPRDTTKLNLDLGLKFCGEMTPKWSELQSPKIYYSKLPSYIRTPVSDAYVCP